MKAADEAVMFLCAHDKCFKEASCIELQSDKIGSSGDVRDILINLKKGIPIGISAKHRHYAIKHSRLSNKIDFGKKWTGYPCSTEYMKRIVPVFDDLRKKREKGLLFRDISDKENRCYLPILTAFEDELRNLTESHGQRFVTCLFQYLLGINDFYKVIKENGHVSITSFNIIGTLDWGHRWKIPNRIDVIKRKRGSSNTLIVSFVGGWQLSFRIHNASTKIEPSLKFDIQFRGISPSVAKNIISLNQKSDFFI